MPTLLRRRLQCFYCGNKSSQAQNPSIRQWQCENCEAVNYLDENGQITDPPALSAPKSTGRYAHQPTRSRSPDLSPQENDLFCRTCLTNQHFYTQSLASYLPPSSDPDYPKYLASYDSYRQGLEERYPQVCADCAPKVNQRLRQTVNVARADHLRRTLEKGKAARYTMPDWKRWRWQRVLVFAGGVSWWGSLVMQSAWHGMGLMPLAEIQEDSVSDSWAAKMACVTHAYLTREVQESCFVATRELVSKSIVVGLLSCWWNNKLANKLYSHGRLRGVGEYLSLQLIILGIRTAALWALQDAHNLLPQAVPVNAAHGVMLVLLLITTLVSLTTVRLIEKPLVSFTGLKPITGAPSAISSASSSFTHTHTTTTFPIERLAPRLPTPPESLDQDYSPTESESNESTMDWTPTSPSNIKQIAPQRPPALSALAQSPYRHTGPSPFRGTIPPAPVPPGFKARNPRALQPFIPASQEKKDNFFKQITGEVRRASPKPWWEGGTSGPAGEEDEELDYGGKKRRDYHFDKPKMRDHAAEGRETGLEGLFNVAFSMRDGPPESAKTKAAGSRSGSKYDDPDPGVPRRNTDELAVPGLEKAGSRRKRVQEEQQQRGNVYDGNAVREGVLMFRITLVAILVAVVLGWAFGSGWVRLGDLTNWVSGGETTDGLPEAVQEVHRVVEEIVGEEAATIAAAAVGGG